MEHLETTYGHLKFEYQSIILLTLRSTHAMPGLAYVSHHLWEKITSVGQEAMRYGMQ